MLGSFMATRLHTKIPVGSLLGIPVGLLLGPRAADAGVAMVMATEGTRRRPADTAVAVEQPGDPPTGNEGGRTS